MTFCLLKREKLKKNESRLNYLRKNIIFVNEKIKKFILNKFFIIKIIKNNILESISKEIKRKIKNIDSLVFV